MPALETRSLYQRAVYWAATGFARPDGQPAVAAVPTEIAVRWNDVKREVLDPSGDTVALEGTAMVDRDIPDGSHLWFGTLADWNASGSAGFTDVVQSKSLNATRDTKGRHSVRTIGLMRLHNPAGGP